MTSPSRNPPAAPSLRTTPASSFTTRFSPDRRADDHDDHRGGGRERDLVAGDRLLQEVAEAAALGVDRVAVEPPLEVAREFSGRRVAAVALLRERAPQDRGEV